MGVKVEALLVFLTIEQTFYQKIFLTHTHNGIPRRERKLRLKYKQIQGAPEKKMGFDKIFCAKRP